MQKCIFLEIENSSSTSVSFSLRWKICTKSLGRILAVWKYIAVGFDISAKKTLDAEKNSNSIERVRSVNPQKRGLQKNVLLNVFFFF